MHFLFHLYNAALTPFRVATALGIGRDGGPWEERAARRLPPSIAGGAWLHGASVGETGIVRALASEARRRLPGLPLAATCTSRTGRALLRNAPEFDAASLLPLDLPSCLRPFIRALSPGSLTLVETELWPNLLLASHRAGIPVSIVNARLDPAKQRRYDWLRPLYLPLVAPVARVGAQSDGDAGRFARLGVPESRIEVTGNVKFDLAATPPPGASREAFGLAPSRPVVAAGSTGEGEDDPVLDAFVDARRDHPELYLILAPRHPERFEGAARAAATRGLSVHRLSSGRDAEAGRADVLLVDTIGRLAGLYALADGAFVGGSLVPVGGHNLLEPVAQGVPVLFGPHTGHVAEVARLLERAGAADRVADAAALGAAWSRLAGDRELRERRVAAGRSVLAANRGALAKSVAILLGDRR